MCIRMRVAFTTAGRKLPETPHRAQRPAAELADWPGIAVLARDALA